LPATRTNNRSDAPEQTESGCWIQQILTRKGLKSYKPARKPYACNEGETVSLCLEKSGLDASTVGQSHVL